MYTSGISELVVFLCAEAGFGQNDQYRVVKFYASVKFLIPIETNCKLFSNIPWLRNGIWKTIWLQGVVKKTVFRDPKMYASVKFLIPIETNCKLFSNIPWLRNGIWKTIWLQGVVKKTVLVTHTRKMYASIFRWKTHFCKKLLGRPAVWSGEWSQWECTEWILFCL